MLSPIMDFTFANFAHHKMIIYKIRHSVIYEEEKKKKVLRRATPFRSKNANHFLYNINSPSLTWINEKRKKINK